MQKSKIIIIATEGTTTNLLYNGLSELGNVTHVLIEPHEAKKNIIKRRFKKIGVFKTMGQLLFLMLILPLIPKRKNRITEIISNSGLKDTVIPNDKLHSISSVHEPSLITLLKKEAPDLVFINGTRILKKALLDAIQCPIVNIHVGITPKYRGVHGGYWAIYNKEPHLFGVTLHFVDKGVDTGGVIAQTVLDVTATDNFRTYPILQYTAGVNLAKHHLNAILEGEANAVQPLTNESQLHYHPTIWQYLKNH